MLLALAGCVKDLPYSGTVPDPDPTPSGNQTLFINEVNCGTKEFEIYNSASEAVDIAGYTFTKDDGDPWTVPAGKGKIPAKGFIVYVAKNADPDEGPAFGLSGTKGFKLCLYDTKDKLVDMIDNSANVDGFQTVEDGWSLSRETDGAAKWVLVEGGTMGRSNGTAPDQPSEKPDDDEPGEEPGEEPGDEPGDEEVVVVLNEINGNDKYIELYNTGETEVALTGWTIEKDGKAVWTASELNIAAHAYVVVYSNKASNVAEVDASLVFNSGISAGKNVKVELKNASGKVVDGFVRGSEDVAWGDQTLPENKAASFSRVPDGVGEWAYADPTPGAANGEKIGDIEQGDEEDPDDDKVVVVLNEISGTDKYFELYNAGKTSVTLEGWVIEKDEKVVWSGKTLTIGADGYAVLYSDSLEEGLPEDENFIFTGGISGKKSVSVVLKNDAGEAVSSFVRGEKGDKWGNQDLPEEKKLSFSRVPNGTGDWAYAEPTPGAANGENAGDIEGVNQ